MATEAKRSDRLSRDNPYGGMPFTERNFAIIDILRMVVAELEMPMAQAALIWVLSQAGATALLMGASWLEQLAANNTALQVTLSNEQLTQLNEASTLPALNT